jgi:two-component system alkaline phosphatase synthesis response regulator PhoP
MHKIGIIKNNSKENGTLKSLLKVNGFELIYIDKKGEEENIESIILLNEDPTDFKFVCEWLISTQENFKTFVWLFVPGCKKNEKEVFFQLGANAVIDNEEKVNELVQMIKNYFFRMELMNNTPFNKDSKAAFELHDNNLSVSIDGGNEVSLTKKEFQVLSILYNNANATVTYEKLYKSIWNREYKDIQKYRLANVVYHLREKLEKLEKGKGDSIKTVRTRGYLLNITQ